MAKLKLIIEGMHCESCSKIIEMELEGKVNKISINLGKKSAEIEFNENKISKQEIINAITKLGYKIKYLT